MENYKDSHLDDLDIGIDFSILSAKKSPPTIDEIVNSLSKDKGFNNINITITINRGLYDKIEDIQKEIQSKSKNKISKSRVVRTICEQFLGCYNIN